MWKRRTNRVQNLAEIQRENDYVPYLPYLRHASDEVIIMPNGCGMRVFELRGRSFETNDFEDLVAWHTKLNIAIRSIADDRFSMWTHIVRRPIEPFQADGFRSDFARALDAKYHRKLIDTTFYENRFYVTIIVKPVDMMSTVLSKWVSGDTETEELNARDLAMLDSKCRDFAEAMKDCAPTALKTYALGGVMFSRPLEVLHYIMTGDDLRIPLVDGPIGQALYSSRIIFGKETIEVRLPHKNALRSHVRHPRLCRRDTHRPVQLFARARYAVRPDPELHEPGEGPGNGQAGEEATPVSIVRGCSRQPVRRDLCGDGPAHGQ